MTAVAAKQPLQMPSVPLPVPQSFVDLLSRALADGAKQATEFASTHSPAERWLMPAFALQRLGFPPSGDAQKAELAQMHEIAKSRTAEGAQTAQFWAKHGLTDAWETYLLDYAKSVGPAQAAAATKLLRDTLDMVFEITQTAKGTSLRKRPYDADPTLTAIIDKPGNSPSYPSGHTSAAIAAAIVLSYLMPARSKEFMNLATQASFARVYGGVHFPSDIASGAKLAAAIAMYMCSIDSAARPKLPLRAA